MESRLSIPIVLICATAGCSTGGSQIEDGVEIAFIANAEGGTVSLLDIAERRIIAEIDITPDGESVERPGTPNYAQDTDISPDGRTLYVARGYLGDVAAFDIATGEKIWVSDLDTVRADHMAITPDGRYLFVSALADNRVVRLDTATGEITGSFVSGVYPHDNQISADGTKVINASLGNMSLPLAARDNVDQPTEQSGYAYQMTVADVESLEVTDRIRMPVGVRPWHMNADGSAFYAQTSNGHAVTLFGWPSGEAIRRIDLPVADGASEADWDFDAPHHGLALSGDGSLLCLAGRASDYAALVSAPDLELIATVPVDDAPGWASLAANDEVCITANSRADTISIISIADRIEVARLPAGNGPKHITVGHVPANVLGDYR